MTVEKDKVGQMTVTYERPESIAAPVMQGQQIGTVRILDGDGQAVCELALRAAADVEKQGFWDLFGVLCRSVNGMG